MSSNSELPPPTTDVPASAAWSASATAVIGADHTRRGVGLQDRAEWFQSEDGRLTVVSVADGHGGDRHFRSAIGADLACSTFVELAVDWFADAPGHFPALQSGAERIGVALLDGWAARVGSHIDHHPFRRDDPLFEGAEQAIARRDPDAAQDWSQSLVHGVGARAETSRVAAYGSTLLGIVVLPAGMLWFQLGDGTLVEADDVWGARRICQPHESAFGDMTPSLCSQNAGRFIEVGTRPINGRSPALVAALTDGFSNSFEQERGMLEFFEGALPLVRQHGADDVHGYLPQWLDDLTHAGSGDDIALAWALRVPSADPRSS